MFRASSEIAVDTRTRSVAGKPHHPASSRPFWRAATMSVSQSMGTLTSPAMSASLMHQSFRSSSGRRSSTRDPMGRPRSDGAEGGTRTPTGCPTRPSNVRVCQFRHFGPGTVAKYTLTSASAKPSHALTQPRIERIANALAEQVVGEHGEEDGEARIDRQPPRELDDFLALVEDVAPRRVRRTHAEAEERQARLGEDGGGDAEGHGHQHGRHGVGQDVAPDDAEGAGADRLRPDHELALLEREEFRAHEARHAHPARETDDDHDRPDRGLRNASTASNRK